MTNWTLYTFLDATEEELAGHALSLFLEGYETSSQVLAFVFYELARNPDVQQRLYEEVLTVHGGKHDNKLTYEALQDMPYLDGVVQGSFKCSSLGHIILIIWI